jgi:hypothetical protein
VDYQATNHTFVSRALNLLTLLPVVKSIPFHEFTTRSEDDERWIATFPIRDQRKHLPVQAIALNQASGIDRKWTNQISHPVIVPWQPSLVFARRDWTDEITFPAAMSRAASNRSHVRTWAFSSSP